MLFLFACLCPPQHLEIWYLAEAGLSLVLIEIILFPQPPCPLEVGKF